MLRLESRLHLTLLSVVIAGVMLSGCSTLPTPGSPTSDGAPNARDVPDVSQIADATPRPEARSRYGNPDQYEVFGRTYYVQQSSLGYRERGVASWYGTKFHGRRTSSGEPYDMYAMTAAHKTLPLPTYVRVRNVENGRSVIVKVNDRGPFKDNRLIDLSYVAAAKLDMLTAGTARVEVEAINVQEAATPRPPNPDPQTNLYLQVGAFSERENAERMQNRLQNARIDQVSIRQTSQGDSLLYRVHIGPLADLDSLNRISDRVESLGIQARHVVID